MGLVHRRSVVRAGFTLVELLVVIAIIALLATLAISLGSTVMRGQKVNQTRSLMRLMETASDQFAEISPLDATYNRRGSESFGRHVPYHLKQVGVNAYVDSFALDERDLEDNLFDTLNRDLVSDRAASASDDRLTIALDSDSSGGEFEDNSRAFYAYLAAFVPDALAAIPERNRKPLRAPRRDKKPDDLVRDDVGEFFNRGDPNEISDRVPILGVVDAWNVPIEYQLHVKLEMKASATSVGWTVVDRTPVFFSHGIDLEAYDVMLDDPDYGTSSGPQFDPENWIFTRSLPSPVAGLEEPDKEVFNGADPADGGWARAAPNAKGEEYTFVP